ncbi:MAG: cytochrome c [Saprospiraceae bacterium]|nr:cytochrome c [Saprospiraceae bacterium]
MNKKNLRILLFFACVAFFAFNTSQTEWTVPEKYEKMANPVASDKESLSIGKSIYNQHCKSCHGKEGLGDGSKAAQLDTPAGDFTAPEFAEQSDGALFYKSWIGRDEMPNFEKKIPDEEDVWHVVNYMRTFE